MSAPYFRRTWTGLLSLWRMFSFEGGEMAMQAQGLARPTFECQSIFPTWQAFHPKAIDFISQKACLGILTGLLERALKSGMAFGFANSLKSCCQDLTSLKNTCFTTTVHRNCLKKSNSSSKIPNLQHLNNELHMPILQQFVQEVAPSPTKNCSLTN